MRRLQPMKFRGSHATKQKESKRSPPERLAATKLFDQTFWTRSSHDLEMFFWILVGAHSVQDFRIVLLPCFQPQNFSS